MFFNSQQPDAEDAKDSQRTQKKQPKRFLLYSRTNSD